MRRVAQARARIERVRAALADARWLCAALGLTEGARAQADGFVIRCPWHDDHDPSCSVRLADNGAVYAKCFACGAGGDVFALVARVRRLDRRGQFMAVVDEAERIATTLASAPTEHTTSRTSARDLHTIATAMLDACPLDAVPMARDYLARRGLLEEARRDGWGALPQGIAAQHEIVTHVTSLVGAEAWVGSGLSTREGDRIIYSEHQLLIPWRDADGSIATLQRRAIGGRSDYVFPVGSAPRWPYGIDRLRSGPELAFVEGAADVLAMRAIRTKRGGDRDVLGVPGVSTWRPEWAELSRGRVVHVAFDNDGAGDAAAARLAPQLHRAGALRVLRTRPAGAKDWAELTERGGS